MVKSAGKPKQKSDLKIVEEGKEAAKKAADNDAENDAALGHNSAMENKEFQKIVDDWFAAEANKKAAGKHQRELKARAKEELGIFANVFAEIVRRKKMEADVRTQYVHGIEDATKMLGYQLSLGILDEEEKQAANG